MVKRLFGDRDDYVRDGVRIPIGRQLATIAPTLDEIPVSKFAPKENLLPELTKLAHVALLIRSLTYSEMIDFANGIEASADKVNAWAKRE